MPWCSSISLCMAHLNCLRKTWLNYIPRPESYIKADIDSQTGKPLDLGLHNLEPAGNAKKSDGFFEKGILKALESEHVTNTAQEVKVIGNGHCHGMFSFLRCLIQIWLTLGLTKWRKIVVVWRVSGYALVGEDHTLAMEKLGEFVGDTRFFTANSTLAVGSTTDSVFTIFQTMGRQLGRTSAQRRMKF